METIISEVYNADCLEYMKSLPDKYFDLCIADPPYGINIQKSGRLRKYNKEWVDDKIPTKQVFEEMFRCSKDVEKRRLMGMYVNLLNEVEKINKTRHWWERKIKINIEL